MVLVVVEELEAVGRGIHESRLGIAAVEEVAVCRRLRHARQAVAVVGEGEVVHHAVAAGRDLPVAREPRDVSVGVIPQALAENPDGIEQVAFFHR